MIGSERADVVSAPLGVHEGGDVHISSVEE